MVAVLTYDILLRVFEFAHESIELPLDTDSNEVKPWGSSHTSEVLEFSLVSRDWRIAAQQTLFRSVILVGSTSAVLFLRTIQTRKDLGRQTRRMIVSLTHGQTYGYRPLHLQDGTIEERKGEDLGQVSTSLDLVRAIDSCTSLRHLHVEPLHRFAREPLLLALSTKRLISLIVTPHVSSLVGANPVNSIFELEDLPQLFVSSLKHLRFDYHDFYSPRRIPSIPYQSSISITTLILSTDMTTGHFLSLLTAISSTLQVLHLTTSSPQSDPTLLLEDNESTPLLADCIKAWSLTFPLLTKLHLEPFPIYFAPLLPQFENLLVFSTQTIEAHINYVELLPGSLNHFIIMDNSEGVEEEMWHRVLWSLKLKLKNGGEGEVEGGGGGERNNLSIVTVVDPNSGVEELFFGALTIERVPWATINEFLEY